MAFSCLLFLCLICLSLGTALSQLNPFFIDCGSDTTTDDDGRRWVGDLVTSDNYTLSYLGTAGSTTAGDGDPIYKALYKTFRIFNSSSNYNFNVSPGIYCVRLHFYPFSFEDFNVNYSVFDITANNLKLLSNFNVPGEISWRSMSSNSVITSLMKEYFLNISSDNMQIEFVPNPGSFAFVNAIEVLPVASTLFLDSVTKVSSKEKFPLSESDRGVETIYRLNIGGPAITSSEDLDLYRRWDSDEKYMFSVNAATLISNTSNISYALINSSSAAPLLVYETARTMTDTEVVDKMFNVSWRFFVDPNFDYLVRLHFCELVYDKANQRVFRIYINNKTAADNYDIFLRAGGMNKAHHEDYADMVSPQVDTLWLQLGPDSSTSPSYMDALLNGLEIFKLSRNGNLADVPERANTSQEESATKKTKNKTLWTATGVGTLSLLLASVASILCCYHIRKKKSISNNSNPPGWHPLVLHESLTSTATAAAQAFKSRLTTNVSADSSGLGRRFTLKEIKVASRNFDESLVIGTGGFGRVYKGQIDEGILVAIKRGHPQSQQGAAEFETEIEMLSKLRHRHLVSLIGYCEEQREMILVYEYMAKGTLRSHLYGNNLPSLSWKQRIEICIGAARGLHYLHTGADRSIIHRDVKTTNILLDKNYVAKMADFGLSKAGPGFDHTHVSTAVKGSFGYLDPEYFRRQQLTQKSDVYSFGVVLFEVVCARPVINPSLPKDQINLAEWAIRWQRQRSLESVVDPNLAGDYSVESMKKFGEIAEKCLADEGKNRPTMGEVLWHMEYALQLHEAYKRNEDTDSFGSSELAFADMSFLFPLNQTGEEQLRSKPSRIKRSSSKSTGERHGLDHLSSDVGTDFSSNAVNPQGR